MWKLPSPGSRRTRATASFRRPVARTSSVVFVAINLSRSSRAHLQGLGLLCLVWMRRPCVDLGLPAHRAAEAVVGQHALDRLLDDAVGAVLQCPAERRLAQPSRVAGVPVPHLVLKLV